MSASNIIRAVSHSIGIDGGDDISRHPDRADGHLSNVELQYAIKHIKGYVLPHLESEIASIAADPGKYPEGLYESRAESRHKFEAYLAALEQAQLEALAAERLGKPGLPLMSERVLSAKLSSEELTLALHVDVVFGNGDGELQAVEFEQAKAIHGMWADAFPTQDRADDYQAVGALQAKYEQHVDRLEAAKAHNKFSTSSERSLRQRGDPDVGHVNKAQTISVKDIEQRNKIKV